MNEKKLKGSYVFEDPWSDVWNGNKTLPTYGEFAAAQNAAQPTPAEMGIDPTKSDVGTNGAYGAATGGGSVTGTNAGSGGAYGNKTVLQLIDEQRNAARQENAAAAQRKIYDAQSSFAQNRTNYGVLAERLAAQGLAGSGYSDYIDASAYATMRGEVAAAHAAEAEGNAEAEKTYYAQLMAEEEKEEAEAAGKNTSYASLLGLAKEGGYTGEEIRSLAVKAELSKADIERIVAAADEAYTLKQGEKEKTESDATSQSYITLLNSAKAGSYSGEEMRDLAVRAGLSGADIERVVAVATEAYGKVTKAEDEAKYTEASFDITANTTDAEIDAWLAQGKITADQVENAKSDREKAVISTIEQTLATSGTDAALAAADKYFAKGNLSEDKYQEIYFDSAIAEIESGSVTAKNASELATKLEKQKNEGKISRADYNNLVNYMYGKLGKVVEGNGVKTHTDGYTPAISVTIGGKEYVLSTKVKADDETGTALYRVAKANGKGIDNGLMIFYGGKYYIFNADLGGWRKIAHSGQIESYFDGIADVQMPTHKSK
jgi:hypothetical protein